MMGDDERKEPYKAIADALQRTIKRYGEVELQDITLKIEKLKILFSSMGSSAVPRQQVSKVSVQPRVIAAQQGPSVIPVAKVKPELEKIRFVQPKMDWTGRIAEVKLGATKGDGGTRDRSYIIGGETAPAFYLFESPEKAMPHPPVFALDVFDMRISLPRAIRNAYGDVLDDPVEWARTAVKKFGADMITLHMVSTDPSVADTPPSEAAKKVEDILQAVKVPICVGGSGNPEKDVEVFSKIAEVTAGERILVNSINIDMNLQKVLEPIKKYGHVVINFSPMDLDKARQINRKVYDYLPKDMIVLDMNCAGIGYGLDYGYTANERARLAALRGDEELQHPLNAGVSNSWAAREAWMKMDPFWGTRETRGPVWEALTGLSMLLAGADYFMTISPTTPVILRQYVNNILFGKRKEGEVADWVSAKLM